MVLSEEPLRGILITQDSPWKEVCCPDEVSSTNAASLADPRPWRVLTTRHQVAGRGRHERVWSSPPGASVAVSLTVPMGEEPARWGWLSLLTGLAVTDALGELTGAPERFALKWPNDVLLREEPFERARPHDARPHDSGAHDPGADALLDAEARLDAEIGGAAWRKTCGILCEAAPRTPYGPLAVVGVGVNLDLRRADLPVPTATSLGLAGLAVPAPAEVVVAFARAFARWHARWSGPEGVGDVRAAYRAACSTLGRPVDVHLPGGDVVRGRAEDVTEQGELVVATVRTDGELGAAGGSWWERQVFAAGDVVHLRLADATESRMIDP